jgi:hypothetical protein
MYIPPPKAKSKDFLRLKAIAYALLIVVLPCCLFLYTCAPKSKLEKKIAHAPELFDQSSNEEIPDSQQLLIPASAFSSDALQIDNQGDILAQFKALPHWESPIMRVQNDFGQLFMHLDFAGIQNTRKDAEIYVLAVCHLGSHQTICPSNNAFPQEHAYLTASTKDLTEYQTIGNSAGKSWYYYAKGYTAQYLISTPVQDVSFIAVASIPQEYQSKWIRLSTATHPIVHTQTSYFFQSHHSKYYKFLLLLLPIIAGIMFLHYRGFESTQVLALGILSLIFFTLSTYIWDLHYLVISCLLISIASMFYIYSNGYFRLIYLVGFLMLAGFALQFYGSMNKEFLIKTGMPLLIGLALFFSK